LVSPFLGAARTWCALGAWCEAAIGLRAIVLPTGFALIALALGIGAGLNPAKAWSFIRKG
jgi:hypothetical protein